LETIASADAELPCGLGAIEPFADQPGQPRQSR
jgi:hypothetical protein